MTKATYRKQKQFVGAMVSEGGVHEHHGKAHGQQVDMALQQ